MVSRREHTSLVGKVKQAAGDLCFRSRYSNALWNFSTTNTNRYLRLAGMVFISYILIGRAIMLFLRPTKYNCAAPALLLLSCWHYGLRGGISAFLTLLTLALAATLYRQPEENLGHRAGCEGYRENMGENTAEALAALARRDNDPRSGPLKGLEYVEVDAQETADGEVVLFHDTGGLARSFPAAGPNAPLIAALEKDTGRSIEDLTVQDLTTQQLHQLHLGGQEGLHVPTLEQFFRICQEERLQRTVAVEVKVIRTNAGRRRLIDVMRHYKASYVDALAASAPADRAYPPFGWLTIISFPFFWAPSFGEFGSEQWLRWGRELRAAGIPVKCCVLHAMDLLAGV